MGGLSGSIHALLEVVLLTWFTADVLTAISAAVAAVGVIYGALQLRQAKREFLADHERSRRREAVRVAQAWVESLDECAPAARKFAESLSEDQCRRLVAREKFRVAAKHRSILLSALRNTVDPTAELLEQEGEVELQENHLSDLLVLLIQHLNGLEVALMSWRHRIADAEMLEEQFTYLVRHSDGHYVLQRLRNAMAGRAPFPCIERFVEHIRQKHEKAISASDKAPLTGGWN